MTTATKPSSVISMRQVVAAAYRSSKSRWRCIDELTDATGRSVEECILAIERAQQRGLVDEGNPRWAHPTRAGLDLMNKAT